MFCDLSPVLCNLKQSSFDYTGADFSTEIFIVGAHVFLAGIQNLILFVQVLNN